MGRLVRILGLSVVIALVGCSRKLEEKSTVSFNLSQFQKVGASAIEQEVEFIAINVSGPSMPRLACIYDTHDNDSVGKWRGGCVPADPANPLKVTAEVPAGSDRLVQVLVIVDKFDTSTNAESEEFRYGEKKQSFATGDNALEIAVSTISGATNKEGSASGRYVFSDGTGFTGVMTMEFKPPTGSPNMEVFKFEVFSGWFSIYLLDNIDLIYRMSNGHILFGGPVRQSSAVFNNSAAVKKFAVPANVQNYMDENGDPVEEMRPESMKAIGFWKGGVADTSKTVCHDTTAYTSSFRKLASDGATPLAWPAHFTTLSGQTCAMGDPAVTANRMSIDGQILDSGGGDAPLFEGPYMKFLTETSGSHYEALSTDFGDGGLLTVSWKYLPGVVSSSGVVGSTVFYALNAPADMPEHIDGSDGFDCTVLPGKGFSSVNVSGTTQSVSVTGFNITASSKPRVIVCPRKSGGGFFRAAIDRNFSGGGGGGGGCNNCGSPATKLVFSSSTNYPHINSGACTLLEIRAEDNSGNPGFLPENPYLVHLNDTNGGVFFDGPDCSTPITPPYEMFNQVDRVWFKSTNTGGTTLSITPDGSEITQLTSHSINKNVLTAAPAAKVKIFGKSEVFMQEYCQTYLVSVVDSSDVPTPFNNSPSSVSVSSAAGSFFAPGDCDGTPNSSALVGSTDTNVGFEFRATAVGPASMSATLSGLTTGTFNFTVSDPTATYARIEFTGVTGPSLNQNGCEEFEVVSYANTTSSGSVRAKVSAAKTYNLSTLGGVAGVFFSDASCTSSITSVSQAASTSSQLFYFKTTASPGGNVELFGDSNDPQFDAESDVFLIDPPL